MLSALGERLAVRFKSERIDLPGGVFVNVDGLARDGDAVILAEVYTRQAALKGGQPDKLLADAIKLATVRAQVFPKARVMIVLTSEEARRSFCTGWRCLALETHRVEVVLVELPSDVAAEVTAAQRAQRMVNAND